MSMKLRKIEIESETADLLEARAAARGVSISQLIAELAAFEGEPIAVDADELAELDRRWNAVDAGRTTVPHDEVVRWLRTWGTPAFRQWHER
jgi:predicted transcriptional regulator